MEQGELSLAKQAQLSEAEMICFTQEWNYWTKFLMATRKERKEMKRRLLPCEQGLECQYKTADGGKRKHPCGFWVK